MRRLLATATSDAFLVEPDADGKILADYALLAPERVTVRLLADEAQYRPSLIGGIQRWQQRFGDSRNLMVRVASANTLYERLILLDGERAWVPGAPFSHLANRHTRLWSECVQRRKRARLRCMRKFGTTPSLCHRAANRRARHPWRCRTCCLRANRNSRPLRYLIFRGSIPHPMQLLCTLRNHCRQWPRNTRYQADATPYLDRTFTGWIAPACGWRTYSITSSARKRREAGRVMPSCFAVRLLRISSNSVGCSTGKSLGLEPFRSLST